MFALYKGKVYQASNFMGRWYLATDRQESEALGFVRRTPSRYYLALKNLSEVDTADLKVLCNVEALGELAQKYIRKKAE